MGNVNIRQLIFGFDEELATNSNYKEPDKIKQPKTAEEIENEKEEIEEYFERM